MGSAPKTVNDRGEVMTSAVQDQIYGPGMGNLLLNYNSPHSNELFYNWLHGVKVNPVDPTESIAREAAVLGGKDSFAIGAGISGLFGFGNVPGASTPLQPLNQGPMAPGVPYSVPPIKPIK